MIWEIPKIQNLLTQDKFFVITRNTLICNNIRSFAVIFKQNILSHSGPISCAKNPIKISGSGSREAVKSEEL